jgi:Ca-activated chloride channel family protein
MSAALGPVALDATLAVALLLPIVVALLLGWERRRRHARLAALGERALVARLVPPGALKARRARAWRIGSAAAFVAIAWWGPSWGADRRPRETEGADVVLVVDVSRSMLATDEAPTRLDRARLEIRKLRASGRAHRMGLVAFAGRAYPLAPLTTDAGALELYLDNLSPDIAGQPGSALGPAIRQATDLLTASRSAADRALVLLTDGESFEPPEAISAAARYAREGEVKLIAVQLGTEAGSTIPEVVDGKRELHRDREGQVVVTKAHPEVIEALAREAGGVAILPSGGDRASLLRGALDDLKTAAHDERTSSELEARFQWFLVPALLLLFWDVALAGWRPFRRAAAAAPLLLVALSRPARAQDPALEAFRAGKVEQAVAAWRQRVKAGDERPATRYNLGTALLEGGNLDSAIAVLDPLTRVATGDLKVRTLFNLGLAHLRRARAPQGDPQSYALAADAYRRLLVADPGNVDAKFNYELARQHKQGGGGGASQPPPQPQPGEQPAEPPPQKREGGLDKRQAEQLLQNAARDERDAQRKRNQRQKGEPPKVEKDW